MTASMRTGRWRHRAFRVTRAVALLLPFAAGPARAASDPPPAPINEFCPVIPQRSALTRFGTTYRGQRVHFCCQKCQAAFAREPERYRASLPPTVPAGETDEQRGQGEAAANYALAKQALRRLGPALTILERTYYRGNDERDRRLWNGGIYRTATFHLSMVAGDGSPLRVGDEPGERPLAVQLDVDRAPGTAEDHFDDADVTRYHFLRAQWRPRSGPRRPRADDERDAAARTALAVVKPGWKWRARYPLGTVSSTGLAEGVLYLTHQTVAGAAYAVYYRVATADGRVQPGSSLFMAAVYGADFPAEQWFSEEPIPEIAGPNTDDRVLLGLEPGAAGLENP